MNRGELIEAIAQETGYKSPGVGVVVNGLVKVIIDTLKERESIKFTGLGTFYIVDRAARKARNPKTGEPVNVPAKTVVKFKPSKEMKKLFLEE